MSIARRIALLLAILIGALVALGTMGVVQMSRVNEGLVYQNEKILPKLDLIAATQRRAITYRLLVLRHVLTTDARAMEAAEAPLRQLASEIDADLRKYESMTDSDEDRRLLRADREALTAYAAVAERSLAHSRANRNEEASALANGEAAERGNALIAALDAHARYNRELNEAFATGAEETFRSSRALTVALVVLALAAGGGFGFLAYRRIVGALLAMSAAVEGVSSTLDFSRRVPADGKDEVAQTGRAFNALLERVQQSLRKMSTHAGEVSAAGSQLASSARQVSIGSSAQSEAAAAMAAAVEQMTVSINHVADRAGEARRLAVLAGDEARGGAEVIGLTLADIRRIDVSVRQAAERVQQLDEDSARVSAVVTVIKEVADQTNLLALNAAIEAARAGEQGRGFAVVADEVRKLAERTAQSTQEISSTMEAMQAGARNATGGMSAAVELVGVGVAHAQQAEASVRQIEDGARRTVDIVAEISDAIREQSVASSSIAQQVERVAQMTDENSAAAASTSDTAVGLEGLAQEMQGEVARYRV
ncbi:methyl-accepting chemotaxis protein [Azoarcus olearius]|uniref:Dipeptide chemoreceptor n=1 Tax=Azoarcus sp. (strain BH72) TaxID=418699 RepID=A1K1P2_AZOSB|nr:methyl-accepting chemotaxis protein [Azoarcus olearius]CAL92747.1 putative dipeptide chemoreceptor [Azoarcus olearius]